MKEKKIGILDPEGKKLNPLTGKKYIDVDFYRQLAGFWSKKLAVYERAEEIIGIIRNNRVIIAEAGTGTGKTVLIPKLALHAVDYKEQVIVTVPKRALSESSSDFAAKTLGITTQFDSEGNSVTEPDGNIVGYWHSKGKNNSGYAKEDAKLIFSTDGSIVPRLNNDPSFENVGIVCVDEVHERNANIDIMLMQLRIALRLNPNLKVILMSATLPKNIFQNYFAEFDPVSVLFNEEGRIILCGVPMLLSGQAQKLLYENFCLITE